MHKQGGFSLLELICVMLILSILAYFGSSHFLSLHQTTQDQKTLKEAMAQLADALLQARQLAVVSGQTAYVCGGQSCSGDWSSGFLLYQETEVEGSPSIYRNILLDGDIVLSWQGFPRNKQSIEFTADGLSGYQNGTFQFCLGIWQAGLVLNQGGRFYTTSLTEKSSEVCDV
ncbi:GspH/FimT family pseudopilin [Marinomonas sp. C2222]|uniref:Type II secretion system protein H n=1 Tax=Marinomonas sargassi TaxID=2984494 RepID=A0ABT2YTQ7_9GAMM|nr:GspH/FimT family pseudopilin [Marinomonas sargassi]MCV2403277.1 GspH/FimT family pseudopilin [Marinomonas sargassi]